MNLPFKFSAGKKAKADEVNANFQALLTGMEEQGTSLLANISTVKANIQSSIETLRDTVFSTIFPIGAIYIGQGNTCPISAIIGTWELVGSSMLVDVNNSVPIKGTGKTLGINENGSATVRYLNLYRSSYNEALMQPGSVRGNVYVTTNADSSGLVGSISKTSLQVKIWRRTA